MLKGTEFKTVDQEPRYPVITRGDHSNLIGTAKFVPDRWQLVINLSNAAWNELHRTDHELVALDLGWAAKVPTKEGPVGLEDEVDPVVSANTQDAMKAVRDMRTVSDSEIAGRFGYHRGTEITMPLHIHVRELFKQTARELDALLPDGRAKRVAFTELENASMWANKAIAEMAPVVDESYG